VTKVEPLPDLVLKVLAAHRRQSDDSVLYDALGQLQLALLPFVTIHTLIAVPAAAGAVALLLLLPCRASVSPK
jgi:hypothetical protein